ncbi:MAG TPA: hypothetical protein VEK57_15590 [Thermoanaerobaculia bacterium]|nr:hypothetical protein [Thermoanaerobaculia bacterium]
MRLLLFLALAIAGWLVSRRAVRFLPHRMRPTALAAVTLSILAALNAVNLCAPGWCGWYGLPFPYYSWSDAMMTFNGRCSGCPASHPLGVAANVAFAAVLCVTLFRRERRSNRAIPA